MHNVNLAALAQMLERGQSDRFWGRARRRAAD